MGDGGQFSLSDLVPFVSVGGKRLRPRGVDNSQGQGKDVRLRQLTVVLRKKIGPTGRNVNTFVKPYSKSKGTS